MEEPNSKMKRCPNCLRCFGCCRCRQIVPFEPGERLCGHVGPHGVDSATRSARAKAGRKSRYQREMAAPLFAAGVPIEEVAAHFGVCLETARNWHNRIKADVWRVDTRDYRLFPVRRARNGSRI